MPWEEAIVQNTPIVGWDAQRRRNIYGPVSEFLLACGHKLKANTRTQMERMGPHDCRECKRAGGRP